MYNVRGQWYKSVAEKPPHLIWTEHVAVVSHKRLVQELSLTAQARAVIRCHIVSTAISYIQYLSYWFLLIKNLSGQGRLVTEKIFIFPLLCEGCVSCGLIFQSLLIHLWQAVIVTGGVGGAVFSQRILRKNNNHVAADVFIYAFVKETMRESEPKDNALNNTTNYTATFFLSVGRTDLNIYYLHKHLVS